MAFCAILEKRIKTDKQSNKQVHLNCELIDARRRRDMMMSEYRESIGRDDMNAGEMP